MNESSVSLNSKGFAGARTLFISVIDCLHHSKTYADKFEGNLQVLCKNFYRNLQMYENILAVRLPYDPKGIGLIDNYGSMVYSVRQKYNKTWELKLLKHTALGSVPKETGCRRVA